MFFFQLPSIPEWLIRRDDFKGVEETLRKTARPGTFSETDLAILKSALREPGAVTAAVNYYRANVGLIALREEFYALLAREVTAERVREHFRGTVRGGVERFELPNLGALNFLLHESLGGGGTLSLMTDAQGKTFSTALLRMEVEVPDEEARGLGLQG